MPLVGIGTLPTPFSPASVPLPPETGGRGHTSLRVGGGGESQFRRRAYTMVLFICTYFVLSAVNTLSQGMYDLLMTYLKGEYRKIFSHFKSGLRSTQLWITVFSYFSSFCIFRRFIRDVSRLSCVVDAAETSRRWQRDSLATLRYR